MAIGFFLDVIEVESVDERKSKDNKISHSYARLKLSGGVLSVRVRDGVKILPGWSGKASGSAQVQSLKREFQGHFYDAVSLVPVELDTWVPTFEVRQSQLTAIDQFMGKK